MVDVLVFGPHPDDIEILAGGLVLASRARGYSVGGVDLTLGEAGTRGSKTRRAAEAREGARRLGLAFRENLGLPDGRIEVTPAAVARIIGLLREHRPRLLVAPLPSDLHPDHAHAGQLVKEARFLAGCARIGPGSPAWRPGRVLFYPSREPVMPSLVVDISAWFEDKMMAVRAHRSQLHDPASNEPLTVLARPEFLAEIEASARHFGAMIGVAFGEPYVVDGPLAVDDPLPLVRDRSSAVFAEPSPRPRARGRRS